MISEAMLGRYECVGNGHNKYWWLVYDKDTQQYTAFWGAIRYHESPRETIYIGDNTVSKKVKEKLKKGYIRKDGYKTVEGNNARHFILSILEKEAA